MRKLVIVTLLFVCMNISPMGIVLADPIKEALENPARSAADKEMDARRKPSEVLAFFAIKPGMKVLDVFAGGGFYSEILSYLVGEEGSVTLYNNSPWNNFVGKAVTTRLMNNRLPNVHRIVIEPADLGEVEGQYDAAIFILGMHDLYYADEDDGWPAIDKAGFLNNIHRLIKDGGLLGIVDHNAVPGSDASVVGKSIHRIDPAIIINDLVAVGFKLESEANFLRNPHDDLETSVFDESIRWQSDRSVLKFRK